MSQPRSSPLRPQPRPLSRLCGLETEYAIHFDQSESSNLTHRAIFELVLENLSEKIPSAPPKEAKTGAYLANGCALWFEEIVLGMDRGLVEMATPECHGPSEVVAASGGLDRLLVSATDAIERGDVRLLKNCMDTHGNYYGAQENYEVTAYESSELESWSRRIGLLKGLTHLCLMSMIFWPILIVQFFRYVYYAPIAGVSSALLLLLIVVSSNLRQRAFVWYMRLAFLPKTVAVSLFYRHSSMGRLYRKLTPFLVSRVIFAGAGGLDRRGRFFLGQKAYSRNVDSFTCLIDFQRPIFCINQIFKDLARAVDQRDHGLYKCRQRLSISIGDSNMCQESEYLRVATTMLVLDAIEAGAITEIPRVKGTIRSLRRINWDPRIGAQVPTTQGPMTAIEIQRFYLQGCRDYVDSLDEPHDEAVEVLRRWKDVLDRLERDPESLFGRIDWITKRALMRHLVAKAGDADDDGRRGTKHEFVGFGGLARLRKIDAKYHEVSADGYYYRLFDAALTQPVLCRNVVERAQRMPPRANPAAQRCRYIREFTDAIEWVSWDAIKLQDNEEPITFSRETQ